MSYCRGCGHQIHETAISCPQCGALQAQHNTHSQQVSADGSLWLPVPAVIGGLIPGLGLLAHEEPYKDQVLGTFLCAATAIVFGSTSLARQKRGKGMAIAGVVLGGIGLLAAIGLLA